MLKTPSKLSRLLYNPLLCPKSITQLPNSLAKFYFATNTNKPYKQTGFKKSSHNTSKSNFKSAPATDFNQFKTYYDSNTINIATQNLQNILRTSFSPDFMDNLFIFLHSKIDPRFPIDFKTQAALQTALDYIRKLESEKNTGFMSKNVIQKEHNYLLNSIEGYTALLLLLHPGIHKNVEYTVNHIMIQNLAYFIANKSINASNCMPFIKVFLSKKNFLQDSALFRLASDKELKEFLLSCMGNSKNLSEENIKTLIEFSRVFDTSLCETNKKLIEVIEKKCFEALSTIEKDPSQMNTLATLFPSLVHFADLDKKEILDLASILGSKAAAMKLDDNLVKLVLECYTNLIENEKLTSIQKDGFVEVVDKVLREASKKACSYNLNNFTYDELILVGDLLQEKKLSIQGVLELLKGGLEPEYIEKFSIEVLKIAYRYDLKIDILDDKLKQNLETVEMVEEKINAHSEKHIINNFFMKLYPFINFHGLLVLLYTNLHKGLQLGRYSGLFFLCLRKKSQNLKDEEINGLLNLFKGLTKNKKYVNLLEGFSDSFINRIRVLSTGKPAYLGEFVNLVIQNRSDFAYDEFQTIDLVLDKALSDSVGRMRAREVEFIMSNLVNNHVQCLDFYKKARVKFEEEYKEMNMSILANYLLRLAMLGEHIEHKVVDDIVKRFESEENDKNNKHDAGFVTTPLKLLSALVMMNRSERYGFGVFAKIINSLRNRWETYPAHSKE